MNAAHAFAPGGANWGWDADGAVVPITPPVEVNFDDEEELPDSAFDQFAIAEVLMVTRKVTRNRKAWKAVVYSLSHSVSLAVAAKEFGCSRQAAARVRPVVIDHLIHRLQPVADRCGFGAKGAA